VTSTLAVPAEPAGVVAVIEVALTTVTLVAAAPPMVTPVAPVKLVPVIVTFVPPNVEPELGLIPLTVGRGTAVKVKWSAVTAALVPPGAVTFTSTVPAEWVGLTIVSVEPFTTFMPVPDVPPNVTAVAPVKPVPLIVTEVPPAADPLVGDTLVIVGVRGTAGTLMVNVR